MAHTIAHTGIAWVVLDMSVNNHVTLPTGRVPLGVTTQDCVTPMSPRDTNIGSVGAPLLGGTAGSPSGGTDGSGSGRLEESLMSRSLATGVDAERELKAARLHVVHAT